MRRDSMIEIKSVSSDGEVVIQHEWRDLFTVPELWQPQNVSGVYGEYSYCGAEANGQDHVSWQIYVQRVDPCGIVINR